MDKIKGPDAGSRVLYNLLTLIFGLVILIGAHPYGWKIFGGLAVTFALLRLLWVAANWDRFENG